MFFKALLPFTLISGVGWTLDFFSYLTLTQFFEVRPAIANFISSVIAVTFVWFVALNRVFYKSDYRGAVYLPAYWGYQALSILGYSLLISWLVATELGDSLTHFLMLPKEVFIKILVTPFNLITNLIFIDLLSNFMSPSD